MRQFFQLPDAANGPSLRAEGRLLVGHCDDLGTPRTLGRSATWSATSPPCWPSSASQPGGRRRPGEGPGRPRPGSTV